MININVQTSSEQPLLSNEILYKRLDNQTPMDFAVGYLEQIEDLFDFYKKFNMNTYNDFYTNDKYRILNEMNAMRLNGFEGATKHNPEIVIENGRIWTDDEFRSIDTSEIRIYK